MKKRGRKPKINQKVLKKRGRKPKGGKIVKKKNIKDLNEKIVIPNIILHLKCNTKDINIKKKISNIEYNPILENTESYTINNVNKKTALSFKTITTKKNKKGKKNENDIKLIWHKLKELKKKLRHNQISNKKSDCFWCTCPFDTPQFYIPKEEKKKTTEVYGCFCSVECATAYLMEEKIDSSIKWERYALLNNMYRTILNYKKNIKPAPSPFYILEKYYGDLSIEEYRKLLKKENFIIIIDKPLTKIFPELYDDDTNEPPNIHSNLLNENNNNNYTYRLKSNIPKEKKKKMMQQNFNFT